MNDPGLEEKIRVLSSKFDALFFGLRIALFLLLFFASFGDLISVFSINNYERIFISTLGPDHPLPALTLAVIAGKTFLFWLVFFWLAIGVGAVFIRRRIILSLLLFSGALLATTVQCVIVYFAMQLPMVTLFNGMSNTH